MLRFLFLGALALGSPAAAQSVFGLVGSDRIVTFDANSPGVVTSDLPILGLAPGAVLTGIDVRPLDGAIYSVSTAGIVYRLDAGAGGYQAVVVGAVQTFPPPGSPISVSGNNFGIDFNPTVDRIRLTSDTDQNLRINPLNGGTAVDTPINNGAGGSPYDLIGVAYTNSFAGAGSTTLYAIDAISSSLVRSTNANGGVYVGTNLGGAAFGPLGLSLSGQTQVGFDILFSGGANAAFLSANNSFYGVNLTTGQASLIGAIGVSGVRGIAFAAVPEPASWAMLIAGFGLIGGAVRRQRIKLSYA